MAAQSRRLSSTPMGARARISSQIATRLCSNGVLGALTAGFASMAAPGAGSALRSIFPLALSGRDGRTTTAAGTM